MKTNILLWSQELTKEDLRLLLQAIRDCEQSNFPEKFKKLTTAYELILKARGEK